MYYQNYEDYIRSILGYPVQTQSNYSDTYNNFSTTNYEYLTEPVRYSNEILDLYPDIYKLLNPMVCKICEANTKPITKELIEQMTDEIYLNIESDTTLSDEIVNVNVNLPRTGEETIDNRQSQRQNISSNSSKRIMDNRQNSSKSKEEITSGTSPNKSNSRNQHSPEESSQREYRQIGRIRNRTLRDLIKILILNQLLGHGRPQRPPRPRPNPPRPPFPGGPGPNPRPPYGGDNRPNNRPPIMPRQ